MLSPQALPGLAWASCWGFTISATTPWRSSSTETICAATYGIEPHALGIPRLKPARGVLASQKPNRFTVSDDDFRLVVSAYHMAFPTSRLFFNTRESYELNISLVAAGDLFTVDCETLPGAYLRRHLPGQFSTHDYPPRREVAAAFAARGFECKYLAAETPCQVRSRRLGHANGPR